MPPSKMDEWFKGRRWRVLTEATGQGSVPQEDSRDQPVQVVLREGHFTIDAPGAFKSPLSGNPGRKGVILQEVDAEGSDIEGSRHPFGEPAVKIAREQYKAVT